MLYLLCILNVFTLYIMCHMLYFICYSILYIRVYPTELSAKDARQSLRRTEVVKNETVEEDTARQEIKQKGDSLRRVPKDENPVLRDMDERADVKVGLLLCMYG